MILVKLSIGGSRTGQEKDSHADVTKFLQAQPSGELQCRLRITGVLPGHTQARPSCPRHACSLARAAYKEWGLQHLEAVHYIHSLNETTNSFLKGCPSSIAHTKLGFLTVFYKLGNRLKNHTLKLGLEWDDIDSSSHPLTSWSLSSSS